MFCSVFWEQGTLWKHIIKVIFQWCASSEIQGVKEI